MNQIDTTALVIDSLKEVLSTMDEKDKSEITAIDESIRLIGSKAVLNSLGLVSLIVDIEQKLSDDYEIFVTIADDRAMSQEKSPFRSVGSLAEYISLLINEQNESATT